MRSAEWGLGRLAQASALARQSMYFWTMMGGLAPGSVAYAPAVTRSVCVFHTVDGPLGPEHTQPALLTWLFQGDPSIDWQVLTDAVGAWREEIDVERTCGST